MSPAPSSRPGKWLLRTPSPQAQARLFCLPYPGCGASMYRQWPRYLGTTEICAVQLPGRENRLREPMPTTFEQLAGATIDGLWPYLDRPFGLFGHCGGALMAFVMAQQLCGNEGPVPARLFVSSQPAPHDGPQSRFLAMDDDAMRAELAALIRELGGTPAPAFIDVGLQVLRADVEMHRRYQPGVPARLACPVTVLGWTRDTEVPPGQLGAWSSYGEPAFRQLDGEHFSFLEAPAALRQHLAADLLATAIGS